MPETERAPGTSRLIDATPTECLLSARRPVEAATLSALHGPFPIDGLTAAVPVVPPGAYGATELLALQRSATVLEPLTWTAHAAVVERAKTHSAGTILVDPVGTLLGTAPPEVALPEGWVRECVAWLAIPAADDPDWTERIATALKRIPDTARLRLRDPAGHLDLDVVQKLVHLPGADRLVLVPENTHGLAVATARIALAAPDGPQVRTTMLGLGPRSGYAPTELLAPHLALRSAAETTALIAGVPVTPEHPLYGTRRHEAPEPETLDRPGATPLWNVATAPILLAQQLEGLGIRPDRATFDRLLERLLARLRPGDPFDGPTLYAFLATHLDLRRHAETNTPEETP